MNERYLPYYDRHTWRAVARFTWDALRAPSRLRRLSLLNRRHDYQRLSDQPALLALHRRLNDHLLTAARQWTSYDYGEGYFYQGFGRIGITGLRNTEARIEAMGLRDLLAGRRVVEIGCNTGFVGLSVGDVAAEVTGLDINPHLIDIARDAANHLKLTNVRLETSAFEDFTAHGRYDAVLSFANHTTYDGNTRQQIRQYFERCRDLLAPDGLLLFESHAPDYEGASLAGVIDTLRDLFAVREQCVLTAGTFLDRGRTFIIGERRA